MSAPYSISVELGKVREFARATGISDSGYLEDPAPHIPPTFLRTVLFWRPDDWVSPMDALNLDPERSLHGEQEFEFFGPPPRAGAELTVHTRLESVTEKQGRRGGTMKFVVITEDFFDVDGKLVARGRTTGIETGKTPE